MAIRVMVEVLEAYESKLDSVTLLPAGGGRFEIWLDEDLVYSKLKTGRHLAEGELAQILNGKL